jgi:hypothetical protein
MANERTGVLSQLRADGGGAAAQRGGVAAGAGGVAAGGSVTIETFQVIAESSLGRYLGEKGPQAYRGMGNPGDDWDLALNGEIEVSDLRTMVLNDPVAREKLKEKARTVSVIGVLYPCALLVSGWWESRMQKVESATWFNGIQKWLFNGFHSWGPSWDFTWELELADTDPTNPSFVAQLGSGDEANSIPVIIPADKVKKLVEKFKERGEAIGVQVGGLKTTVTGVLCHRSQCPEAAPLGLVGGILDFCIWLKPGEAKHKIKPHKSMPDLYSAYLWKCLAPSDCVKEGKALELSQVYFVWEHTNLADQDSVKYNLDSLERKEAYIRTLHDNRELVLLQKSSILVPGKPMWSKKAFYDFYQQKEEDI